MSAQRQGILDEVCAHMPKNLLIGRKPHNAKWNFESLTIECAKYANRYQLRKNNPSAFNAAKRLKLLNTFYPKKDEFRNTPYSDEEIAKEIGTYKNKNELKTKNPYLYRMLLKHPNKSLLLSTLPADTRKGKIPHNKKWTEITVPAEAAKYSTRISFLTQAPGAYDAALDLKIMDTSCAHMKRAINTSSHEETLFNLIKKQFPKAQKLRVRKKNLVPNKPYINGFDLDTYIPELRKGIEFDGRYWHSPEGLKRSREHWPEEDIQNYHQIKDEYFKSKGIEILHIREEDWLLDPEKCISQCLKFLK